MRRLLRSAAPLALALAACIPVPNNQPDAGAFLPHNDAPTLQLSGIIWDPEVWHFNFMTCGMSNGGCPLPPLTLGDGKPQVYRALVRGGADVSLLDPVSGFISDGGTRLWPDGGSIWEMHRVPRRDVPAGAALADTVPYYVMTSKPNGGPPPVSPYDGGTVPDAGVFMPPVPAANAYLPAQAARPIYANAYACYGIKAPVAGNAGVLDAVARYLTNTGTPTTFDDLADKTRYGGVIVYFAYQPVGLDTVYVPAFGTSLESTVGTVLKVAWTYPGNPPVGLESFVSPRGFFLPPSPPPVSPTGIHVILLPPNGDGPTQVTLTVHDPTTDPTKYRPWNYPPQTILVRPGRITIGEQSGVSPYHEHRSLWECQP